MSVMQECDPDFADFYEQSFDKNRDWRDHDPVFEWTEGDLQEFERERLIAENERLAMAAWWEDEGVRCWTFGFPRNPYLLEGETLS